MPYSFELTTLSEIAPLIEEIETTHAFVIRRGDVPPFFLSMLAEVEEQPNVGCFALRERSRDAIAGIVTTLPHKEAGAVDIGPLYVRPAYRGQGLGKRLIKELIQWAKTQGLQALYVQTWGRNARARHTFESVGFTFVKETANARVNGDSTVTYRLCLKEKETKL